MFVSNRANNAQLTVCKKFTECRDEELAREKKRGGKRKEKRKRRKVCKYSIA